MTKLIAGVSAAGAMAVAGSMYVMLTGKPETKPATPAKPQTAQPALDGRKPCNYTHDPATGQTVIHLEGVYYPCYYTVDFNALPDAQPK